MGYKTREQLLNELTQLRRRVAALEESKLRPEHSAETLLADGGLYDTTFQSMADAIHVVDRDLRIILFNKKFKQWCGELGLNVEGVGQTVSDVFPFLSEKVRDEYEKVFRTGQILITEEATRAGDELYFTETRKIPLVEKDEVKGIITVIRDITERKRAEQRIIETEQLLEGVLAASPIGIGKVKDRVIVWVNETLRDQSGYTQEELQGRNASIFYESDEEGERVGALLYQEGRAEARMVRKDGIVRDVLVQVSPTDSYSYIFSVVDITEQKEATRRTQESEEKFRHVFALENDALFLMDHQTGAILDVNDATCATYGYTREELLRMRNTDVSAEPAETERTIRERQQRIPVRLHQRKDGTTFMADISASYFTLKGRPVVLGAARDITERAKAEREVIDSEQRYRSVFDNSLYGIMLTQPDGTILAANKHACEMFGMTEGEIIRVGRTGLIVEDERLQTALAERARTGQWRGELSARRADGSLFPIEVSSNAFLTSDWTEMTSMAIQDITERKKAEDAVRASAQKFKAAFMTGLDAVYIATLEDGRAIEVNDEFEHVFGYAREEVIGKTVLELNLYDDPADREKVVSELATRGWIKDFEAKGKKKSEERIICSLSASVMQIGDIPHILGVLRDITERKRDEEKLRESALQLSEAADLARIVYWEQDSHTDELIFNDPFYAFYGTTAEREGGYRMSPQEYGARFVHPDDLARYVQFRGENPSGELLLDLEHRIIRRDGQVRHILVRVRRVDDGAGGFRLYGANQDITDRKEAEKVLRKSEMSLAAAQQIAHIGSWEWDVVSDSALWSDETFRIFELQPGNLDPHRRTFLDVIHPDDRPRVDRALSDALDGIREYDLEYRICLENGKEKVIHALGEVVRGADGRPLLMRGTVHDLTDRRYAEEERAKLWSAVERAGEGVFMLTPDVRFSYVNPATCKIYGFAREEIIGSSAAMLRSDVHPPSFYDSIYAELKAGNTWSGRQTRRRKDGSLMEAETTMAPVFDASGTLIHYVGVERDITERLRLESQLVQAQKMEAIGTLAGGVAHDFNNILTVIMGLGNLIQMSLGPDDRNRPHVDQIVASSGKAADLTQSLLAFSRKQRITLEPHNVGDIVTSTAKLLERLLPRISS